MNQKLQKVVKKVVQKVKLRRNLDIKDRFISLTNDVLFKDVLTRKENIRGLERILEVLLHFDKDSLYHRISLIEKETIIPKNKVNDKAIRADVLVKFDNYIVDLEMYNYYNEISKKKSFVYILRLAGNLDESENYDLLKSVIGINFIRNIPGENISAYEEYAFVSTKDTKPFIDGGTFKIITYNLDKISEIEYNDKEVSKVLRFLCAESFDERAKIVKGDKIMEQLNENIKKYTLDENTQILFQKLSDEERKSELYYKIKEKEIKKLVLKMKKENIPLKTIAKISELPLKKIESMCK